MIVDKKTFLIYFFYFINFLILINPELTYLILVIFFSIFLYNQKLKISELKKYFSNIFYPILIVFFGIIFSFSHNFMNIIRDFYHYTFPLFLFSFGFLIAYKIRLKEMFYHIVICASFLVIYQFADFFIIKGLSITKDIEEFHSNNMYLITLGLSILLIRNKISNIKIKPMLKIVIVILLITSILLANQRTLYLVLIVFVLSNLDLFSIKNIISIKNTVLSFIVISLTILTVLLFGNQINEKISGSFSEIIPTDFDNQKDITLYWRAYESYRALTTFNQSNFMNKILGSGFGKTIDLETEITIAELKTSQILRIHNGYFEAMIKSGLLGLIALLLFYLKIMKKNIFVQKFYNEKNTLVRQQILGISIIFLITTFVIRGWLNPRGLFAIIIFFGYLIKKQELIKENYYA